MKKKHFQLVTIMIDIPLWLVKKLVKKFKF